MRSSLVALLLVLAPWMGLGALTPAVVTAQDEVCPVTQPDPGNLPPAGIDPSIRPAGLDWVWYGNSSLFAQLPPQSTLGLAMRHGRIERKFPWFRLQRGALSITGHPVGAPQPHLLARIPAGYGNSGFQSTLLRFPMYGCWSVTGRVHGKTLSFVVSVMPGSE